MIFRVEFDSNDPEHLVHLKRLLGQEEEVVSLDFVRRVRKSPMGELFIPLVRRMEAGRPYAADELSNLSGGDMTAVKMGHRISSLGQLERSYEARLFARHGKGKNRAYSVSPAMKAAFA